MSSDWGEKMKKTVRFPGYENYSTGAAFRAALSCSLPGSWNWSWVRRHVFNFKITSLRQAFLVQSAPISFAQSADMLRLFWDGRERAFSCWEMRAWIQKQTVVKEMHSLLCPDSFVTWSAVIPTEMLYGWLLKTVEEKTGFISSRKSICICRSVTFHSMLHITFLNYKPFEMKINEISW